MAVSARSCGSFCSVLAIKPTRRSGAKRNGGRCGRCSIHFFEKTVINWLVPEHRASLPGQRGSNVTNMLTTAITRIVLPVLAGLGIIQGVYGQSCNTPRCSPNPVPCAQCTGSWTDNYGFVWNVTSNNNPPSVGTYSISGTLQFSNPAPGCPGVTYQLSGTISQYSGLQGVVAGETDIDWMASGPSPPGACGGYIPDDWIRQSGTIVNDSCDYGSGTWSEANGQNGSFTMTKPTDTPDGNPTESSTFVAWWSAYPTVALFEQTIASSKDLAGRQVYEASNGDPSDGCWFSGSAYPPATLSGGGWYVGFYYFNSSWDYDYVGMDPTIVDYYRNNGRAPCLIARPQAMRMYTSSGDFTYFTDVVYVNIASATLFGVQRAGVTVWRAYP